MNKTYTFLCAVLGITALQLTNNKASLSDEQLSAIENHLADLGKKVEDRDKTIADLQAKLAAKPAVESKQVVEDSKPGGEPKPKNDVEQFVDTYNSARALYNEV